MEFVLQVHPVRRITILQIREHPWFVKDLPPYLFPLPGMWINPYQSVVCAYYFVLGLQTFRIFLETCHGKQVLLLSGRLTVPTLESSPFYWPEYSHVHIYLMYTGQD